MNSDNSDKDETTFCWNSSKPPGNTLWVGHFFRAFLVTYLLFGFYLSISIFVGILTSIALAILEGVYTRGTTPNPFGKNQKVYFDIKFWNVYSKKEIYLLSIPDLKPYFIYQLNYDQSIPKQVMEVYWYLRPWMV